MKVTIVIPNYNGLKYLKDCIDSLYKQSFTSFDIIVVDNGSMDGSCHFIEENYAKVILIKLNKNYGFSRAVNEGIKASKSEYVVLLNNDTETDENWLANLINCIQQDEKIFSCCSKMIQYHERQKIDDAGDGYNILGWAYKIGEGANIYDYMQDKEVFSSCAGAAIYRKKVFNEIGYFDENFFAYLEDLDISYRAKLEGYKNLYCSKAIVYHIGCGTSGSKYNAFKARMVSRNNLYVIFKNMPLFQLIINLPFILIGILVKALFYYKRGLFCEYAKGVIEAFKNYKNINTKKKYRLYVVVNYFKIEGDILLNTAKYIIMKIKLKNEK